VNVYKESDAAVIDTRRVPLSAPREKAKQESDRNVQDECRRLSQISECIRLGGACMINGDRNAAIENYKKSLELDPRTGIRAKC